MIRFMPGDPFAYRGTHSKPRSRTVAKVTALAIPMTLAGTVLVGATPLAAHAAVKPVNWTARTCSAFSAWERHPTMAHLDTLVTDSLHVSWRYLGNDVWALYADVRSGSVKYVDTDKQYVAQDCYGGL